MVGRESVHVFRDEYLVAIFYAPLSDTAGTKLLGLREDTILAEVSILEGESSMVVDLCRFV